MAPSDELNAFIDNLSMSATQKDQWKALIAALPVSSHRKWVEGKIKDPIRRRIALDAATTYEDLMKRADIRSEELAPILTAFQHPSTVVSDTGALLLKDLAKKHTAAFDAFGVLFSSKKWADRFNVIAYLRQSFPRTFLLDIVSKGLNDKSYMVRWKSAQACGGLSLSELLPLMTEKLSIEKSDRVLDELRQNIGILKDGYYLFYSEGGHPWLALKKTNGKIIIKGLRQEQLDREGVKAIFDRERKRP